jgi:hypothetical protein
MKRLLIILLFSGFIAGSLQAQDYFVMQIEHNKIAAEKKFASQYKIKSIKRKKFCPSGKNGDCYYGEDYSYERTYDTLGNMLTDFAYPWAYYSYEITYTYINSQLGKKFYSFGNDYGWYYDATDFAYDNAGRINEKEVHHKPSYGEETWTKKIFTYTDGWLSQVQEMERGGDSLYHSGTYTGFYYDAKNNMIKETHNSSSGKRSETYNYRYDSKGNIIRIIKTGPDEKDSLLVYEYNYDDSGDTILCATARYDDEILKTFCVYNDKNLKTEEYNDDISQQYHVYYEYDSNGKLSKEGMNSKSEQTETLYVYNDKGLVSEKKIFDKTGNYLYSEKFTYEYYE